MRDLDGPNGYFASKWFPAGLSGFLPCKLENNSVKTNKDRNILSMGQILAGTLVSGNIRFMRIFAGVL